MPYKYSKGRGQGRNQKRKRWFAEAKFGNNVPFLGGTGIRLGTRQVKSIVKRQALKQEETKKNVNTVPNVAMTHGTLYTTQLNILTQGSDVGRRNGDSVFYCGINMKFQIACGVSNSLWRVYVVRHRESYGSSVQYQWGSGLGSSLMFRNGDISPWSLTNNDDVQIVCRKTLKIDQQFSGEVLNRVVFMNCRIMKKFQFRSFSSSEGEYYNYYLVIMPYSETGAPVVGTTSVGSVGLTIEQVFKDA